MANCKRMPDRDWVVWLSTLFLSPSPFRRHHHPNLARKVDVIYALAQAWCNSNEDSDFEMLEKYLSALKPEETILVIRPSWLMNRPMIYLRKPYLTDSSY